MQVEEGKYYLEDPTAQVLLDFSQALLLTDGFVTENSIVLIEGEAVDGVLHVHHIGELRYLELESNSNTDFCTILTISHLMVYVHIAGSPLVENRSSAIQAIGLQNTGK